MRYSVRRDCCRWSYDCYPWYIRRLVSGWLRLTILGSRKRITEYKSALGPPPQPQYVPVRSGTDRSGTDRSVRQVYGTLPYGTVPSTSVRGTVYGLTVHLGLTSSVYLMALRPYGLRCTLWPCGLTALRVLDTTSLTALRVLETVPLPYTLLAVHLPYTVYGILYTAVYCTLPYTVY